MGKLGYAIKKMLFKLSPRTAERLRIDFRLHVPNRRFLEGSIFEYLNKIAAASARRPRTLFVGIDKYNWHYPRLLNSEFHSLDVDPRKAVYGQPGRHWTGSATSMSEYYGERVFDVVVANGLVGYGINDAADFRRLVLESRQVLKPGGLFVLGYNDRPDRAPFPVVPVVREFFDEFVPSIAGVQGALHRVDDPRQHVFVFLRKREASPRHFAPQSLTPPTAPNPVADSR